MTDITTLPLRSEVPVEQTWDLESIYATPGRLGSGVQRADRAAAGAGELPRPPD